MNAEQLAALQAEIYEVNKSKGWHDEPLRVRRSLGYGGWYYHVDRILAKLALIHSELSEAWIEDEAKRRDVWYSEADPFKPEGMVVELADTVIRVLDTCAALGLQVETVELLRPKGYGFPVLHALTSAAVEAVRVDDYVDFNEACNKLVAACGKLCESHGLDLWAAVRLKVDFNKTRPHRHGGKKA